MTIIVLYILLGIIAFIVILLHFSVRATIKASRQGVDIKVKWLFFTLYPRKPKKPKKPKKKKGESETPPETAQQPDLSENGLEQFIKEAEEVQKDTTVEEKTEKTDDTVIEEKTVSTESETVKTKTKKKKDKQPKTSEETTEKKGKIAQLKDKFKAIKPYIPTGWKYFKKLLKKIRFTNITADVTVGKEDAYEAAVWYGKVQGILFGLFGWLGSIFTVKLKRVDVHCKFNEKVTDGEIFLKVKVRPSTMIHIAFCLGINFLRIWLRQRRERKRRIKAIRKKRQQALKQKQMNVNNTQKG
ncbi:MAG: hypothetical protein IJ172_05495 [Ruminococcus sp.]|nr:hypothetical protein [Ruminococcus sp.]